VKLYIILRYRYSVGSTVVFCPGAVRVKCKVPLLALNLNHSMFSDLETELSYGRYEAIELLYGYNTVVRGM
jgi:hypothetical protein